MRKALGYFVLIFCSVLYMVSSDQVLTDKLTAYKIKPGSAISMDKYRYGDLYGMCYLSYFRKHFPGAGKVKAAACHYPRKIDLYAVCDSYIWAYLDSSNYYCDVDHLFLIKNTFRDKVIPVLDGSKINVLLIEFGERNVRYLLEDPVYNGNIIGEQAFKKQGGMIGGKKPRILSDLFSKQINTNIESNSWDVSWFTPIKEFKADLNYKLFGAIDDNKDVAIADSGKQLFFEPTVDTFSSMSSFKYLSDAEMDMLVGKINAIYQAGRKMGFGEIWLTIVPNPVSVLEPHHSGLVYNRLVERIQGSPKLQVPYIDLEPVFNQLKGGVYSTSDSHWNLKGAGIWLDKFNAELEKAVR
jgi:hypothetical protein